MPQHPDGLHGRQPDLHGPAVMTAESYQALRGQLASEGRLFEDEDFPATEASIYYVLDPAWEGLEWKRPGELCDSPKFQHEGSTRFDLAQGDIGNCWFLSAATTLALHRDLYVKVVPQDQSFQDGYAGLFYFSFWRYGEWMDVVVDDRLPTRNGRLAFCHNRSQPDEFWGALLEKAYAKVHGSYQALETGYSHDALVDFTGGIGEFIDLVKERDSAKRIFKALKRSFKMNSMLCAAIDVPEGGGYEDKLSNGLVTGHAYSITKVAELTLSGQKQRLLRLRNPWGRKEWSGAWSDGSAEWSSVSEEDRERFDLRTEDDGEFWMVFEDLMSNFSSASICHLTPDSVQTINTTKKSWHVATHHGSWVPGISAGGCGAPPNNAQYWSNPQYTVRVVDPDEADDVDTCTVVVSLMQKYRRQHKTLEQSTQDMEQCIGFDLLKFRRPEEAELDEGNHDNQALQMERRMLTYEYLRERACRFTVQPGTYCLIPCMYLPDVEGEFLLRVATEQPLVSEQLGTTGLAESSPAPRQSTFDRLFVRFAGDDGVVDAKELRQMLNKGLLMDGDEEFTKETSRALLAWAKYPEKGGTMDTTQCKKAWSEVRRLQDTFHEFDVDDSNTLNRTELRKAFQAIGLSLTKSTLGAVTMHFCGKQKGLAMEEFVLLGARISTLFTKYEQKGRKRGMTIDEWLETTLLV